MTISPSRTGTLYAGTAAMLTCSVALDPSVDTAVPVHTTLLSPSGGVLGTTHNTSIAVSPLAEGQYSCGVIIAEGTHLVQSDQVNDSLSVAGEEALAHNAVSQSVSVPFGVWE